MRDLTHYYRSCEWNYKVFRGFRWEPICSRVYRNKRLAFRPFRFAFIKATNHYFKESSHCERIHLIYLVTHFPVDATCR